MALSLLNPVFMRYQQTIKKAVSCSGIGLHSGKPVSITLKPAALNTGIVFIRTDLKGFEIPAVSGNTGDTGHATSLTRQNISVRTVEHLLSALSGMNVDNARIDMNAEEVPVMDGSAGPFTRMIMEAGIEKQEQPRSMLKVINPVFVREGNKQIAIWPAETMSISFFIDFDHPMINEQNMQYQHGDESYLREVAHARTFGFVRDVKTLQAKGLAKGASLENAIALGENAVLNNEGLRYRDEFVRHKILDLIGDLSLIGMPVIGHVVAHKSGHAMNSLIVKKLLENRRDWIVINVDADAKKKKPAVNYQHAIL